MVFGAAPRAAWISEFAEPWVGSSSRLPDGRPALEGKIVEIDPPRGLVTTFEFAQRPEGSKERPSRFTWEIEPQGPACRLTLTHDDFDGETATYKEVAP